jgi:hypothetical protein
MDSGQPLRGFRNDGGEDGHVRWRSPAIRTTLLGRGCTVRQEQYSRGLIDLSGSCPWPARGPVIWRPPTFVGNPGSTLQRPLRLRTFLPAINVLPTRLVGPGFRLRSIQASHCPVDDRNVTSRYRELVRDCVPVHPAVQVVGWVERSETHQPPLGRDDGFRFAQPILQNACVQQHVILGK